MFELLLASLLRRVAVWRQPTRSRSLLPTSEALIYATGGVAPTCWSHSQPGWRQEHGSCIAPGGGCLGTAHPPSFVFVAQSVEHLSKQDVAGRMSQVVPRRGL